MPKRNGEGWLGKNGDSVPAVLFVFALLNVRYFLDWIFSATIVTQRSLLGLWAKLLLSDDNHVDFAYICLLATAERFDRVKSGGLLSWVDPKHNSDAQ